MGVPPPSIPALYVRKDGWGQSRLPAGKAPRWDRFHGRGGWGRLQTGLTPQSSSSPHRPWPPPKGQKCRNWLCLTSQRLHGAARLKHPTHETSPAGGVWGSYTRAERSYKIPCQRYTKGEHGRTPLSHENQRGGNLSPTPVAQMVLLGGLHSHLS